MNSVKIFFAFVLDPFIFSSPSNLTTHRLRGSLYSHFLKAVQKQLHSVTCCTHRLLVSFASVTLVNHNWSQDQIGPPSFPGHGRTHRPFLCVFERNEGERNSNYMLYIEFHGSCIAHVGIAYFEIGFLCFWWRRRRSCLIFIEISQCVSSLSLSPFSRSLQFIAVSSFLLCFKFITLQLRTVSPIYHCLKFRALSPISYCVSNLLLSPISYCASNLSLSPISHCASNLSQSPISYCISNFSVSPVSHCASNCSLCLQILILT